MHSRLPALTLLIATLSLATFSLARADDPLPTDEPEVSRVELKQLREDRSRWLGEEVEFVLQLDAELVRWNPWITRFGTNDYRAFSVWADEALLWDAAQFAATTPRIFVRRGSAAGQLLGMGKRYHRFRVRAVVRSIFLDEPWIELLAVERLTRRVGEGTILHATRAVELMAGGHHELAQSEFERARTGRCPAHVERELKRLQERCEARLHSN